MYEHNDTPSDEPTARQDAIDINDFVFAATGARVRRLTTPEGEHWFVAADVATDLGYANTRQALGWHVAADCTRRLDEIAQGVYGVDTSRKLAAHKLQKSMKMVNLKGLVALVNGCTKPECGPFKTWVSEVVATIQRDGSYTLEPAAVQPAATGGTAYVMPVQVADAIVRLEERNIRADEMMLAFQAQRQGLLEEQNGLLRANNGFLQEISHSLRDIADALRNPADGPRSAAEPKVTAQELLAAWRAKNLVVTDDVHAVAAYLAPALVRGEARYRVEDIVNRTGLSQDRVHDCLRMLLKRGCVRQAGCEDGAPVYVLP
ncbi:Bro-N domain-containing protein [Streptomyces sp. BK239]|uniref:BRO-N domain-containing protein n=1 Tax=Streptomyces sp. BK239 TaxID=2512155 RepID=UPI00102B3A40|nr:Bro-N domain-containing protein [Streptomyces sp. BK239]RZU21887.1 BRO family protein [Streptomyces sp. BK239]